MFRNVSLLNRIGYAGLIAIVLSLLAGSALAQPPATINIHGLLTDGAGVKLEGTRVFQVRFFDSDVAGAQLGAEIVGDAEVNGGYFNIPVVLPVEALSSGSVWYELAIDTDTPQDDDALDDIFAERTQVHSVPFAKLADGVMAVDAERIADGSVDNGEFQNLDGVTANIQDQIDAIDTTAITQNTADVSSLQTEVDTKADDADLTAHVGDVANPHAVSATQVGLGSVNNTADADKPVSTAAQAALDAKADDTDLTTHTSDVANPHAVSATQVGLGSVNNTADADKPVSTAAQAALDGKVDDAELTAHTSDLANPHAVTATQVGLGSVNNTADADKPVSTAAQAALDTKADDADLTTHTSDVTNPHAVTATQVGLGNVNNTADADKPVSAATQTALDLKADDADLTTHTSDVTNPHAVTATQVGLGNVDNTADADKPVSDAAQTALDAKADDADLTAHKTDASNPHAVTADQVGLGNVDNTADADKPVSDAAQTALDAKADDADLTSHTGNTSNPHTVTAAQVGLANVNNTADADKPVSTATQTALNLKANSADVYTKAEADTAFLESEADTLADVTGRGAATSTAVTLNGGVNTDTVGEATADTGVTADGVLLKDSAVSANDVTLPSTGNVYLGAPDADGSWRIARDGTNLVFQRRESGVWVTKTAVSGS